MKTITEAPASILCVDDEPNILTALKRLFRQHGHHVQLATSGKAALEILQNSPVDLVISDMRMPEMDGAHFLTAVKANWPDTVRILLTGYADINSTIEAINQGEIHRYITKPWDDQEILLVVRQSLERQALLREKTRLQALTIAQNEALQDLNANLEKKVLERTEQVRQANEKLKASFFTSIKIFANLIELREPSLAGHSRRVAELSRRIAQHMGLDAPQCQQIFLAGLLHDIGKIGLPDHILQKPLGQLNGDELGRLRKHPLTGQQALMALPELHTAAQLVRMHHEQFDGQGYPEGLSGLAIPQGARILSVANDFDSLQIGTLTVRRLTAEEARQLIVNGSGKRYDPKVVQAFTEIAHLQSKVEDSGQPVTVAQLRPGMVLAKDLVSREGVLLLSADHQLDESLIHQIREFTQTEEGRHIDLFVRRMPS